MSGIGSYNAATWLLDRNVDEGRADKTRLHRHGFRTDLRRIADSKAAALANMLRRLGVRREERVAMIMLDTVDFPVVFLGAIRAGIVPVPLNTLLTADQYAYVLADCRARVLFVSEALLPVVKDIVGRMPDLEHVVVAGNDAHGHKKLSDEIAGESDTFTTARRMPTSRRSGCIPRARPACPRACGICIPISPRPRRPMPSRCSAFARTMSVFGGEIVFRLWPRQCADLSDVGRRHHRAQFRASDAGDDVRADEQI